MSQSGQSRKLRSAIGGRARSWRARADELQETLTRLLHRDSGGGGGFSRILNLAHRCVQWPAQLVLPIRNLAGENAQRLAKTRSRWWEPIYQRLAPWLRSRRKADLIRGLPALIVLLALASGVAIITGTRPTATRNASLLREAQIALADKQYSKAAITYERLLQVGGNDNEARFGLARSWAAMGEVQQASMLLRNLAPDDSLGYLPAHRVRAFLILQSPQASASDLENARMHLQRVLNSDPDDSDAHGMLGTLYIRQGQLRPARDEFAAAARSRPETALNAAMISRQIGDKDAMVDFASRAAAFNKGALKNQTAKLPAETVLSLAQSLCLQKKFDEAIETIEELMARSDRDRLEPAILEICRAWQGELDLRGGADDLERFRLVKCALAHDSTNRQWQVRLLVLTDDKTVVRPVAVQLAAKLAQENAAGSEVCFFLGMEAFSQGDIPMARNMLERSLVLKPGHAATANNLACALMTGRNQDSARALRLVDQAIAAAPENGSYHETRGEALLALQRWEEAAAEFEFALPRMQARADAHRGLSMAYEKMGFPERAREQDRMAVGQE